MENISMKELKIGDIFTSELKLNNREAFLVIENKGKVLKCVSRNDNGIRKKLISKKVSGNVIKLRNISIENIEILN